MMPLEFGETSNKEPQSCCILFQALLFSLFWSYAYKASTTFWTIGVLCILFYALSFSDIDLNLYFKYICILNVCVFCVAWSLYVGIIVILTIIISFVLMDFYSNYQYGLSQINYLDVHLAIVYLDFK